MACNVAASLAKTGARFSSMTGYISGTLADPAGGEQLLRTAEQSLILVPQACPTVGDLAGRERVAIRPRDLARAPLRDRIRRIGADAAIGVVTTASFALGVALLCLSLGALVCMQLQEKSTVSEPSPVTAEATTCA